MEGKDEIKKMGNVVNHHVGSGGDAHLPATTATNGFATADQIKALERARGRRESQSGTDVLTMETGQYEIAGALNNPIGPDDRTYIEYNISDGAVGGGRRQLWGIANVTGDVWFRTVHTGGDPSTGTAGWNKMATLTPIWQGNVNAGTIKFNRSLPYYKNGIEVFYRTISGQRGSVRIMHSDTAAISIPNNPNDQSDKTFQSYELTLKYDKNSLTITRTGMKIIAEGSISNLGTKGVSLTDVYAF